MFHSLLSAVLRDISTLVTLVSASLQNNAGLKIPISTWYSLRGGPFWIGQVGLLARASSAALIMGFPLYILLSGGWYDRSPGESWFWYLLLHVLTKGINYFFVAAVFFFLAIYPLAAWSGMRASAYSHAWFMDYREARQRMQRHQTDQDSQERQTSDGGNQDSQQHQTNDGGNQDYRQNSGEQGDSSETDRDLPGSEIVGLWLDLLGLQIGANPASVRRAYLREVSEHHPDRVAYQGRAAVAVAEERTKLITAAYTCLVENGLAVR